MLGLLTGLQNGCTLQPTRSAPCVLEVNDFDSLCSVCVCVCVYVCVCWFVCLSLLVCVCWCVCVCLSVLVCVLVCMCWCVCVCVCWCVYCCVCWCVCWFVKRHLSEIGQKVPFDCSEASSQESVGSQIDNS